MANFGLSAGLASIRIVGVDLDPARKVLAGKFGMTHFVNLEEVGGDLVADVDRSARSAIRKAAVQA